LSTSARTALAEASTGPVDNQRNRDIPIEASVTIHERHIRRGQPEEPEQLLTTDLRELPQPRQLLISA
jgi:hypothetical protein